MRFIKKLDKNLKTASRRFGKSIVCNIITGSPLVTFIVSYSYKLIPVGMVFEDPTIAFSLAKGKALVVPMYDYPELLEAAKIAGLSLSVGAEQDATIVRDKIDSPTRQGPDQSYQDIDSVARRNEPLLRFLQQKLVIVNIPINLIPKGIPEYIKSCNVLIESLDVGHSISGTLVPKKVGNSNDATWNRR